MTPKPCWWAGVVYVALPRITNSHRTPNFQVSVPKTPSVQVPLGSSVAVFSFSPQCLKLAMPGKTAFAEFPWSPSFLPRPELDQIISLPRFGDKAGAEQTCHYLCFNFALQIVSSQCLSTQISSSYQRDNNWLTNQHNSSITPSNLSGGFCKWLKNRGKSLAVALIGIKSRQYLTMCLKKTIKNTVCV